MNNNLLITIFGVMFLIFIIFGFKECSKYDIAKSAIEKGYEQHYNTNTQKLIWIKRKSDDK